MAYTPSPYPQHPAPGGAPADGDARPPYLRWALWVAIVALIAAAVVCVFWVVFGPDNDIVGRAFLTIVLLAGFAGVAILDASLAPRRPAWFVLTSMVVWVVILLDGVFLIWMPAESSYGFTGFNGIGRFAAFVLIVVILQLALLHARLYLRAHERYSTGFTRAVTIITVVLVAILAIMLVVPLTFYEFIDFSALYWRLVVGVAIFAALGTALVPLVNLLLAPKAQPAATGPALPPWPTFADGMTPLPVLPDGSPDWNAYYTGYPTYPPQQSAQPSPPQQSWPAQQPHPGQPHPAAAPQPYPGEQHAPSYPAQPPQQPYPPQQVAQQPHPQQAAAQQAAPQHAPQHPAPPAPGYEGYPAAPPPPR